MDEGMLDARAAMERFLRLVAAEPDIAKVPVMVDSSRWEALEAGLPNLQGQGVVNSISLKEGEAEFLPKPRLFPPHRAAGCPQWLCTQSTPPTPRPPARLSGPAPPPLPP